MNPSNARVGMYGSPYRGWFRPRTAPLQFLGVGITQTLRPQLIRRRGIDVIAFFQVLRDETGDVLLEPDDEVRLRRVGWHVVR
jgi:hypothetical protein